MMSPRAALRKRWSPATVTFAAAALLVGALALLPQTGWLVRLQLRGGFAGAETTNAVFNPAPASRRETALARTEVARLPGDFGIQLADVIWQEDSPVPTGSTFIQEDRRKQDRVMARLWEMQVTFPREPALPATYLRLGCLHGGPGRMTDQELGTSATLAQARAKSRERHRDTTGRYTPVPWEDAPEWVAEMASFAEKGRTVDPNNGFFPFMLAACRFAQHHDEDALQLLDQAGRCRKWNDYTATEVDGTIRMRQAVYGEMGAISRVAVYAAQLFPHFATLRATARIAVANAIVRERSGDVEGGYRIRRSLRRVGGLMRAESPSLIGSLVGSAISRTAAQRPGGAAPPPDRIGEPTEAESLVRMNVQEIRYRTYLTRIKHPEEAAQFADECRRAVQSLRISRPGIDLGIMGGVRLVRVGLWQAACLVCLMNAFWMLLGGAIGVLILRGPRARDTAPLHVAARRAFQFAGIALVAGALSLLAYGVESPEPDWLIPLLVGTLVLFMPLPFLWRNVPGVDRAERRLEGARSLKIYGKVLVLTVCGLALVAASTPLVLAGPMSAMRLFQSLSGSGTPETQRALVQASSGFYAATLAGGLCVFLTGILGIVASIRGRVPVSLGIARAFRAASLPVASVLLVLYAGAVIYTTRVEAQVSREVMQGIRHEGRYYAAHANVAWPGSAGEAVEGE